MDYGHLTDNNGRKADFRHVIIIMTTNVGAIVWNVISLVLINKILAQDSLEEVKQLFSPEFRNRLDAIMPFHLLGTDIILKIVDKNTKTITQTIARKNMTINDFQQC